MNEVTKTQSYNEDLVAFFETDLMSEADLIYRVACGYSLDQSIAYDVVSKTYKGLVKDLVALSQLESQEIRIRLLSDLLKHLKDIKPAGKPGKTVLLGFLKDFEANDRLIILLSELGGLLPKECADLVGKDEVFIRKSLAKIRKELVTFCN